MEHVIGSDHEFTVPKCQIMRLLYFSTLELGFFMGILNIISFRTKTRYTFFSSKKKNCEKENSRLGDCNSPKVDASTSLNFQVRRIVTSSKMYIPRLKRKRAIL